MRIEHSSCVECGTEHPSQTWLLGASGRAVCGDCAQRLRWHLNEAKALAELVGLDLERLRVAVSDG